MMTSLQQVMRALSCSSEQVLALASSFSKDADSYLVSMQGDDGNYQTQAINIHNKPRQGTVTPLHFLLSAV